METGLLKSFYQTVARDRSRLFTFVVMPDGQLIPSAGPLMDDERLVTDIIPGSFNPLHDAHRFMYDNCPNTKSRYFELSIHRIDKSPLELEQLEERLKQFAWYAPVWVTNASLFYEKSGLINRGCSPVFNIGYDTARRLVQHHGVLGVQGIGANFRVYRRTIDGKDLGLEHISEEFDGCPRNMWGDVKLPDNLAVVSSTAIRAKQ